MAISTPTLDVFYIDLNGAKSADSKLNKFSKGLATVGLLANRTHWYRSSTCGKCRGVCFGTIRQGKPFFCY